MRLIFTAIANNALQSIRRLVLIWADSSSPQGLGDGGTLVCTERAYNPELQIKLTVTWSDVLINHKSWYCIWLTLHLPWVWGTVVCRYLQPLCATGFPIASLKNRLGSRKLLVWSTGISTWQRQNVSHERQQSFWEVWPVQCCRSALLMCIIRAGFTCQSLISEPGVPAFGQSAAWLLYLLANHKNSVTPTRQTSSCQRAGLEQCCPLHLSPDHWLPCSWSVERLCKDEQLNQQICVS